eukprot:scaffold191249_cov30-Tisochrysis_lutea.AAC.6
MSRCTIAIARVSDLSAAQTRGGAIVPLYAKLNEARSLAETPRARLEIDRRQRCGSERATSAGDAGAACFRARIHSLGEPEVPSLADFATFVWICGVGPLRAPLARGAALHVLECTGARCTLVSADVGLVMARVARLAHGVGPLIRGLEALIAGADSHNWIRD